MAVPKHKVSKSCRNMRRSHLRAKARTEAPSKCPRCQEAKLPHRVCIHCGFYKDMEVIKLDKF
ncbi:50S ribosomal protein L32 [bacterium]|nr:50S ribosomal protein L32 [bacterium]